MIMQQRDEFITQIIKYASLDRDIVFLSADFGAPKLDEFREKFPNQFYHLGISEQNMIDVAIGLAERGKKVFTYAMAPFVSFRCAEQHKIAAMMELPICNIIAGVGLSYANAGPTHYATEDLSIFFNLIGSEIFTPSDSSVVSLIAENLIKKPVFSFVRLDRASSKTLGPVSDLDFKNGFRTFYNGKNVAIVSHGFMTNKIINLVNDDKRLSNSLTHFDLIRSKPLNLEFFNQIRSFENIIFVDEQIFHSSLGTLIGPQISNEIGTRKTKIFSLEDKYLFDNIGRDLMCEKYGLSTNDLKKCIFEMSQ